MKVLGFEVVVFNSLYFLLASIVFTFAFDLKIDVAFDLVFEFFLGEDLILVTMLGLFFRTKFDI